MNSFIVEIYNSETDFWEQVDQFQFRDQATTAEIQIKQCKPDAITRITESDAPLNRDEPDPDAGEPQADVELGELPEGFRFTP